MSSTTIPQAPIANWQQVRDAWIAEVNKMAYDVERWAAENDWDTKRETKELLEDEIGAYEAPVVRVQTMQGRIYFEPTARFVGGANGRIEIAATPSFWQATLLKTDGGWRFMTEDLEEMNKGWTREDFSDVVSYLLKQK
jgi:hypothetical protein